MKQITIFLSYEWKELVDTVRRELSETTGEEEIKRKVKSESDSYIRATYLQGFGVSERL
jgi:hypothetical protein